MKQIPWIYSGAILLAALLTIAETRAEDGCDEACQAARKAQDPLSPIKGVLTDFTSAFGPKTWSNSTRADNYQFQPVYSLENLGGGEGNMILRGIIPLNTIPPMGDRGRQTGIGDTILQGFYVPPGQDSGFSIGYGPQISMPTRSSKDFEGPGWGAGPVLVGFGGAGPLVYGGIVAHLWGQNGVSSSLLNPIVFYNWSLFGGSYIGYSNSITYDWKASSGNRWNAPLGLTAGKAFVLDNDSILDVNFGFYAVPARADTAGDRQFKWAVSWIIP
ncbi:hypothetical protein GCM10007895_16660 [Paraferrimonas sedimenticola]|uniref:Transporter n=2 Tax=Paraferrimonas sedimenticola TaxID=375674 RepID=A0AA37RVZ4_9GAMM|nr:hypothetical protein GCM10007895_16660 [Paraferrimonas sedimenticola]